MKSWGLTANLSEFSVKLCTFTFNKLQQFLNLSQYTGGEKEVLSCLSNRFFSHPFKIQKKVHESILHKHQYSLFPEYPLILFSFFFFF